MGTSRKTKNTVHEGISGKNIMAAGARRISGAIIPSSSV